MHKEWQIQDWKLQLSPPVPMANLLINHNSLFQTLVSTSESFPTQCFRKLLPTNLLQLTHIIKPKKIMGFPVIEIISSFYSLHEFKLLTSMNFKFFIFEIGIILISAVCC